MSTFREIVYMVMDQNKLASDDSYIEESHIIFLASKLRAYILKQKYEKMKMQISPSNFQTLCLELEPYTTAALCLTNSNTYMLRSTKKIPNLLLLNNYEGLTTFLSEYGANLNYTYVNNVRFESVGYDRWVRNTNYVTIGNDGYLYVKSSNPEIEDLENIKIHGVFENAEEAALLECDNTGDDGDCDTDILDKEFPLEEGLIQLLIDTLSNALYQAEIKPKDDINNANDSLNSLYQYLSSITKEKYK